MAENHDLESDGILSDGVPHYPEDKDRRGIYTQDREFLASFQVPVLKHADNPHEHLFVAAFDGTGNDAINDPQHQTNVAMIAHQIEVANDTGDRRIAAGYIAGAGTQPNWIKRTLDGMDGYTAEERAETMYKQFIEQAYAWKKADPQAQISLADIGFSRGGDEAAIFARLVHERGIQDPRGATYTYTSDGLVKHAEYSKPPLVAPGQVAQAVALFDPVGTGNEVRNDDRRLPPSVISGFQLISIDEKRKPFKSDHIIDPGISADGRFAGVYVPGAHSDVGGSYHRDGLSLRAGNMVIDYLNRLSDEPFLNRNIEPDDPRLNVVHRSEEGLFIYQFTGQVNRLAPEGYNELLVPRRDIDKVPDPYNAEPVDERLRGRHELRSLYEHATSARAKPAEVSPEPTLSLQLDRMLTAARANDWEAFGQDTRLLAATDAGRQLRTQASTAVDGLEQTALRQSAQQASLAPAPELRGPVR